MRNTYNETCENGKYQNMDNTKIGIKRRNSYRKNEDISRWEAQINAHKLNRYILALTEDFLNQKRINVREHTVKIASRDMVPSLQCVHIHLFSSD
jgi:hypothetical protein